MAFACVGLFVPAVICTTFSGIGCHEAFDLIEGLPNMLSDPGPPVISHRMIPVSERQF